MPFRSHDDKFTPRYLSIDEWLRATTYEIVPEVRERLDNEFRAHYDEFVRNSLSNSLYPDWAKAHSSALDSLGSPRIVRKMLLEDYLLESEQEELKALYSPEKTTKFSRLFSIIFYSIIFAAFMLINLDRFEYYYSKPQEDRNGFIIYQLWIGLVILAMGSQIVISLLKPLFSLSFHLKIRSMGTLAFPISFVFLPIADSIANKDYSFFMLLSFLIIFPPFIGTFLKDFRMAAYLEKQKGNNNP